MGGVLPSVPKLFQQAKAAQPDPATRYAQNIASGGNCYSSCCWIITHYRRRFLKVLQPMQMDLQQVLRQKEKADQQPY
jgi:hypothetical protein